MARDISAQGAVVTIKFNGGGALVINEFSDEGTPFECQDVDISTNAKNLNGEMISSRTPALYTFSVTVIPNSRADVELSRYFRGQLLQPGQNQEGNVNRSWYCDVSVSIPKTYEDGSLSGQDSSGRAFSVTYGNCRPKSGPIGPSTSAEGRLSARTYTFEAESVTM